ncbi:MAG TPA: hypothetical protein PKC21_05590 [Oligoflexia bacterium]|nr:hypothetical protein [Oligoflexia bacterium]HMR24809.1 hypothetical protein [Oligoflexia bacterium]
MPRISIVMQDIFFIKMFFASFYFNTVVIVVTYLAFTRKPYEAMMWSLFLYSLTNAFGIAWGSSLSMTYIILVLLCLAFRQSIFISGYIQKFILCFIVCLFMFIVEHWLGGIFQRSSAMLLGTFFVMLSQCLLYAIFAPFVLNLLIWIDCKTLSKLRLQEQNVIFAQQREGLIATF